MDEKKLWDYYNKLLLSQDIERIRKMLIRYSLNIPGDIIECGVFKGVGLMYWLKLLRIFAPDSLKKVIGFDTFTSFGKDFLLYEERSAEQLTKESEFEGVNPNDILKLTESAGFANQVRDFGYLFSIKI